MAFKMKRPLNMKGPIKRSSMFKIGKKSDTLNSGIYYNSKMEGSPMTFSPSTLKQVEEGDEMAMEEMGMMGGMEGMEAGGPPPEAPPTEEGGEDKAKEIFGQEIQVVGDGKYIIDTEDLGYGIGGVPDGIVEVLDPDGILGNLKEGEYVPDHDFTFKVEDGKVIIIGEEGEEGGSKQPPEEYDPAPGTR